jgi:CDP-glucose 4,6-dehydratase
MNPSFWRGKRVFVTGHTGFKGSWLCLLLDSLGARVAGYALDPPTQPNLYSLARVDELVESSRGDVRDLGALADNMNSFAPEFVIHMAAQSVVLQSYEDPVETFSTNILGTVHTLEAVRRMRRPCTFINVTTDKCYENKGLLRGYREDDVLGGRDPYSNSKASAELVGQSYRDSFFPPSRFAEHSVGIASARAGNVIGGGDWTPRQLIPDAIAAFTESRPVVLRHPEAVRPWQHVLDCLGGYLSLAEALARDAAAYSGGWNIGPSDTDPRTVSCVVERLASRWGIKDAWQRDTVLHAAEESQLTLDVTKAAVQLGWRCTLTIDEALDWVASWYSDFHRGQDAMLLCRDQIARYLAAGGTHRV